MVSIIKERPADPIQFLIDRMTKPESKINNTFNYKYSYF